MWSVHPCHVQETIEEILATSEPVKTITANSDRVDNRIDPDVDDVDRQKAGPLHEVQQAQLRWLDCWFMVTATLINLRP